jgi:N-acetylneuraminate synthase
MIPFFRCRYHSGVGLSDHSGTIYPSLAAVTLGVEAVEVHLVLSRDSFGPDVPVSLTPAELRTLVDGVRFIETMKANPVDKDAMACDMAPVRALFTKSIAVRMPLPKGTVLTREHLTLKKPGSGIPADRLPDVVSRRLCRSVDAGEFLAESDFEEIPSTAIA